MIKILLDIDGVMVTTPSWRSPEFLEDGFLKFNEASVRNLSRLITETNASIILTTTHRINYSESEWVTLLSNRGISSVSISKINDCSSIKDMSDRSTEIEEWVDRNNEYRYIIIDDDSSINRLSSNIKSNWVMVKSLIGFDGESYEKAIRIINSEV